MSSEVHVHPHISKVRLKKKLNQKSTVVQNIYNAFEILSEIVIYEQFYKFQCKGSFYSDTDI